MHTNKKPQINTDILISTTHNVAAVLAMQEEYRKMMAFLLPFRQSLKNNVEITLTPDDYQHLFIHVDKTTRTRIEPPNFAPALTQIKIEHLVNQFDATVPTSEVVNHLAVPQHMKISRKVAVVAPGTTPTEADYRPIDSVGRSKFSISFVPAEPRHGRLPDLFLLQPERRTRARKRTAEVPY